MTNNELLIGRKYYERAKWCDQEKRWKKKDGSPSLSFLHLTQASKHYSPTSLSQIKVQKRQKNI